MKVGDLVKPVPRHYSKPYGYTTEDTINHGTGIIIDRWLKDDFLYFKVQWYHVQTEWWLREDLFLVSEGNYP